MNTAEEDVQNGEKTVKKKRSQSERVGRLKHMLEVLKRIESRLGSFDRRLNRIEQCWAHSMAFDRAYVEEAVCKDEVDREILKLLFEAGSPGMLPKDIASRLERFKTRRFQVSRRILRMNKRLTEKIDRLVAEQRGWHWAMTSYCYESWGKSKREVEEEYSVSSVIKKISYNIVLRLFDVDVSKELNESQLHQFYGEIKRLETALSDQLGKFAPVVSPPAIQVETRREYTVRIMQYAHGEEFVQGEGCIVGSGAFRGNGVFNVG